MLLKYLYSLACSIGEKIHNWLALLQRASCKLFSWNSRKFSCENDINSRRCFDFPCEVNDGIATTMAVFGIVWHQSSDFLVKERRNDTFQQCTHPCSCQLAMYSEYIEAELQNTLAEYEPCCWDRSLTALSGHPRLLWSVYSTITVS